jgi:hypothetical protein
MREADKTIERLMTGLRDIEPPAEMQRRILEAMRAHEAAASDPLRHGRITPWLLRPSVAMSLACAAALAAWLIVAVKVHQPWHAPAETTSYSTHAAARRDTRPVTVAQKAHIEPRRTAARVPARRPRVGDVSAADETQAASYPAPPLPLTEQEKLLLRLAHRDDAENTAMLSPDLQATQSAKATQQFQQFFEIDAKEMRKEIE